MIPEPIVERRSKRHEPAMAEFVSEPITPLAGGFDTKRMGRGVPGLPQGFQWRGEALKVVEELRVWKESTREGGRPGGELYLRRHYYRIRMSNKSIWTVYFVRQGPRQGNPKNRWFLYTRDEGEC